MQTYRFEIEGTSPYSQSRHHQTPKLEKEASGDFEERTWRARMHTLPSGEVFIPPMAIKNCLAEAAKFLATQIPGKGKQTYTKHFEAGLMVVDPLPLGVHVDNVPGESLFVPADGRRGGKTRVVRTFGRIEPWAAAGTLMVIDETITEDVLRNHFEQAGSLIGIGRFRPRNNGFYGRFRVTLLEKTDG